MISHNSYYIKGRIVRASDNHYWGVSLIIPAPTMAHVETVLQGISAGLKIHTNFKSLDLDMVYVGAPGNTKDYDPIDKWEPGSDILRFLNQPSVGV